MKMKPYHTQRGFTLIEFAMVLLVVGFVIGPVFSFISMQSDQEKYQTTVERQKKIAIALSNYAQKYGVVPCPGRPDDTRLGRARPGGCATQTFVATEHEGIVPYRDLGLTQTDIVDGYGNPFTYAISGAIHSPINPAQSRGTIHQNCRLQHIWFPTTPPWVGVATDPMKARFCCLADNVANILYMRDAAGNDIFDGQTFATNFSTGGAPGLNDAPTSANTQVVNPVTTYNDDILPYTAYVLISHGKNGGGAYIFNSTARKVWNMTASTLETDNGNAGDNIYRDVPINTNITGGAYFDDIVLWRTQEMTIAETSKSSCARP